MRAYRSHHKGAPWGNGKGVSPRPGHRRFRPLCLPSLLLASTVFTSGMLWHGPAFSQGDADAGAGEVEQITVYARKRAESVQEVPIAVSVLSQELVQDGNLDVLSDFVELVPNATFTTDNDTSSQISIRGSGRNIGDEDPSVGLYKDGVYIGGLLFSTANFFDIAQVEILRGPQAGLYGRNAVGGALNISTERPEHEFGGYVDVQIRSKDRQEFRAAVNGPIVEDKWSVRVAGLYVDQDGGFDFIVNQDLFVDAETNKAIRARSLITPNDSWEFLTTFEIFEFEGGGPLTVPAPEGEAGFLDQNRNFPVPATDPEDTGNQFRNFPHIRELEQVQAIQEINWTNEYGVATAIVSYRSADFVTTRDEDLSIFDVGDIAFDASQDSLFVEARFASNDFDGFQFVAGVNYLDEDLALNFNNRIGGAFAGAIGGASIAELYAGGVVTPEFSAIFGAPAGLPITVLGLTPFATGWSGDLGDTFPTEFVNEQTLKSIALFLEASYDVTDRVEVWGNIRYTRDKKAIDYAQTFGIPSRCPVACPEIFAAFFDGLDPVIFASSSETFKSVRPGGGINVRINDDVLAYGKVVTGFKAGGFNSISGDVANLPFDEENTIGYEIGTKTSWYDNRLIVNAAAFFQTRNDALVTVIDPVMAINSLGVNAGKIRNKGLELEMSAQPTEGLAFDVVFGYLDAKFNVFEFGGFNFAGNQIPNTFKFTFAAVGSYTHPIANGLELFIYGSYRNGWDGFTDLDNVERLSNPEVVDMRAGFKSDRWKLVFLVDNLFDHRFTAFETNQIFDNGRHFGTFAPGRTFGVQGVLEF